MPDSKFQQIETAFLKTFNEKSFKENLSKEDFERYLKGKEVLSLKKGDTIFDEGDFPQGVYFIDRGTVKLSKSGFFKKEQILRFCVEGDLVGYRSLLCDEPFGATAEAMEDAEITFLPAETFNHLLEADPKLSYAMLQKIAYELGEASKTITFLAQKTVRERLAEVLLLLEQKLGTDPEGFIKISLTREEIANLVGTATESAIRLISEFKQDELISVDGRNIRILNHDKLKKLGHVSI
ncbi:Crp/Fnr family transcriptional regulator [Elizabethkingia anophelis]|jgi:CRP-like cAMP-binding protein|uniref:CRP-like cAMP-binding protein n=7 Tax=Elizabethkingia TaxID=308865 RepID=A0AAQ1PHW2_ELIMR|nr:MULTISPECIES: Crp/Fnr family transcriptional regulator [Elizabethkingia]MDR2230439.1 Crp/Fnr family transcriptional regulator [Flavobacteriaceae bacterium]AIL47646.1 transcriptional regulator, Crp/Fnr family [Elizabethkingia anophelis NUHP1]AJW64281.1 Transcriptional activator protein Anr [Elizabethkingia miricola]AKH96097.1 Crp/Fnr family transcriptional regulator [Elizabethkingia anophelis FMS-007]AMR42085.1 Crp/Fnr family transcriptional regulator [Elizabethkingia anophelis]